MEWWKFLVLAVSGLFWMGVLWCVYWACRRFLPPKIAHILTVDFEKVAEAKIANWWKNRKFARNVEKLKKFRAERESVISDIERPPSSSSD